MRSPMMTFALAGAVILGMTAASAQVQGDRPTVDHQFPGADVAGEDVTRGATAYDTTQPRTGTGAVGVRYDDRWDMFDWGRVETGTYYGYFVDLFSFVSGEFDPRRDDAPRPARDPEAAAIGHEYQMIAFVEDRAALTEMLVDTGYLAIFPQDAEPLRAEMMDLKGQRMRVTGQKIEHDGLNLLRVISAEPAAPDEGRIFGRADRDRDERVRDRDHRIIEDQPGFEQRETTLPRDARTGAEIDVDIDTRATEEARRGN